MVESKATRSVVQHKFVITIVETAKGPFPLPKIVYGPILVAFPSNPSHQDHAQHREGQ